MRCELQVKHTQNGSRSTYAEELPIAAPSPSTDKDNEVWL